MNITIPNAHRTRPATPDTPLTGSLYCASHTIEDLTAALAEFSHRVPSPDPPLRLTCCCGKDACENMLNWLATKTELESRLRLSAEVGHALLQRHEAYVRRHENQIRTERQVSLSKSMHSIDSDEVQVSQEDRDNFVAELMKEKALLEKRLNQALINNEVSEASTKSILQELNEARSTISRLTASQARSTGWDSRLSAAVKERDDMQQERDIESQRAKLAESRFVVLKEKTAKLQTEVRRLEEALESKRIMHMESSEHNLQDARTRIQLLHSGQLPTNEHDELMRVLESLVNDNEILKRDNGELHQLLSDCREDFHALQEQVEEHRANQEPSPRTLRHKKSIAASLSIKEFSIPVPSQRSSSLERNSQAFEPLTPETNRRPLSPVTHISTPSEKRWPNGSASAHPPDSGSLYPPFQISYDIDPDTIDDDDEPVEKPIPTRSLPIRSRGVQVNGGWSCSMALSQSRHIGQFGATLHPPPLTNSDLRSDSSSFSSESLTSRIAILLERLSQLFTKLSQADALTLTNRLKRQHLYHNPGDVKHLSRSTVNQILAEATALRSQFRVLLEDEKVVTVCTRKEVRALFRLTREMFAEMGRMRVVLNDVILDPSEAPGVSEAAMDPSKREENGLGTGSKDGWDALNWIGPLSKFFSHGSRTERHAHQTGLDDNLHTGPTVTRSTSNRSGVSGTMSSLGVTGGVGCASRPRTITVPKNAPALAAIATTVNVEFSGAGMKGKSVTNTFSSSAVPVPVALSVSQAEHHNSDSQLQGTVPGAGGGSKNVMDIFAGAPMRNSGVMLEPDPWIVLPKVPRKVRSSVLQANGSGRSTPVPPTSESIVEPAEEVQGKGGIMGGLAGLSRYVDAVIDPVFGHAPGQTAYLPAMPPPITSQGHQRNVSSENPGQSGEWTSRPRLRRGLSDSSIHSTFASQAGNEERPHRRSPLAPTAATLMAGLGPNRQARFPVAWPDRQSVMQALSRTVQNFRLGQGVGNGDKAASPSSSSADTSGSGASAVSQSRSSAEQGKSSAGGESRGVKAKAKSGGRTGDPPRRGVKIKPHPSALMSSGVPYYANTVSGAMGAAALLNSLPGPASLRDPFVWEA
ncbi:hypothetical protein APHAL10511_001531 [Amanita phalloides]|nr:hypothetical protein APHAL10511_001531 [Amanita phalloides]